MRVKHILPLIMLCFILAAAGCGKTDKDQAPQDQAGKTKEAARGLVDPRSLITNAEAEAALGEPVKDPEYREDPMGNRLCVYSPVKDSAGKFIQVSVSQDEGFSKALREQGYTAAKLYNDTKANILANAKPVPGIGDDAVWGIPGLHILKGNVYITIAVGNTDKPENLELAKKLAAKAMEKL